MSQCNVSIHVRSTEKPCGDADGPVSSQVTGGFLLVVASTPSTGSDALFVQVLGGHPPSD